MRLKHKELMNIYESTAYNVYNTFLVFVKK